MPKKLPEGSVNYTLHPHQTARIDEIATQAGLTRNQFLRKATVYIIKAHEAYGETMQIEEMIDNLSLIHI